MTLPHFNGRLAPFRTRRAVCFVIVLIWIGCLAAAAQELPAKLTVQFAQRRFKMNDKIHFNIELTNISTEPFYVKKRIDVQNSDPLIGQFVLEVKQKGSHPFRDVFQGFLDYGPFTPSTDEQYAAKSEIVLLHPGESLGKGFENRWRELVGPPSTAHPQDLQGPGVYIVRVRYVPWRDSFSKPSMILDKTIVSDEIEVAIVR
jgi:hypothetical protein